MSDYYDVAPPGGYSYDEDFNEAEENERYQSLADWVVESAIEEYMMRKKGMKP